MLYDRDSERAFACVLGYVAQEKVCVTAVCCSAVDVCCIDQSCDFSSRTIGVCPPHLHLVNYRHRTLQGNELCQAGLVMRVTSLAT